MAHAFDPGIWRVAKEEAMEGDMGGGRAVARVSDPVISPPAPGNRLGACARALGIDRAQRAKRHDTAPLSVGLPDLVEWVFAAGRWRGLRPRRRHQSTLTRPVAPQADAPRWLT